MTMQLSGNEILVQQEKSSSCSGSLYSIAMEIDLLRVSCYIRCHSNNGNGVAMFGIIGDGV